MTAVPEPTDALIQAIALAYHRAVCAVDGCRTVMAEDIDGARAAYAAMVEHLGLVEEWGVRYERQTDPRMDNASGVITVEQRVDGEVVARAAVKNRVPVSAKNRRAVRRLVSRWEQP